MDRNKKCRSYRLLLSAGPPIGPGPVLTDYYFRAAGGSLTLSLSKPMCNCNMEFPERESPVRIPVQGNSHYRDSPIGNSL